MFFEFTQNNSGGSFQVDDKICHRLIIEADSEREATWKAEELGVYFNGCENGQDCPCCGDRWYGCNELVFPLKYSSFGKSTAEEFSKKYNAEIFKVEFEKGKKPWIDYKTKEPSEYGIIFSSPENYGQYLADEYGWTLPDVRIFYKEGDVIEITGKVLQK